MKIYVGTCGYAYKEWDGYFYPPNLPMCDRLTYYAERFRAVELDSLFYQIPRAETLINLGRRTRKEFRFTVKAHRSITHETDLSQAAFRAFREAVKPLAETGKLGAVLAQFPTTFRCERASVLHLRKVCEELAGLPLAVEFRHSSWNRPGTFDFLRKHGVAYCAVDEPDLADLLPPIAVRTANFAYVRLHGRNKERWFTARTAGERHAYRYSQEELEEWAVRIEELAHDAEAVYVMFSNIPEGGAVQNARYLAQRLGVSLPLRTPRRGAEDACRIAAPARAPRSASTQEAFALGV